MHSPLKRTLGLAFTVMKTDLVVPGQEIVESIAVSLISTTLPTLAMVGL